MIIVLTQEDITNGKIENLHKIDAKIKDFYNGKHNMLEILTDDVIILQKGSTTKILKKPGEQLNDVY